MATQYPKPVKSIKSEDFLQPNTTKTCITIWLPERFLPVSLTISQFSNPRALVLEKDIKVQIDREFSVNELVGRHGHIRFDEYLFEDADFIMQAGELYYSDGQKFPVQVYIPDGFGICFAMVRRLTDEAWTKFDRNDFVGKESFHCYKVMPVKLTKNVGSGDNSVECYDMATETELCGFLETPLMPKSWGVESKCSDCGKNTA